MTRIAIILIFLFITIESFCTLCIKMSLLEEVKNSDHIFVGKVKQVGQFIELEILKIWKGKFDSNVDYSLINDQNSSVFEKGKIYVVFSKENKSNFCSRTSLYYNCKCMSELDEIYSHSIYINPELESVLKSEEYKWWYEIRTNSDTIDTKNKRVLLKIRNKIYDSKTIGLYNPEFPLRFYLDNRSVYNLFNSIEIEVIGKGKTIRNCKFDYILYGSNEIRRKEKTINKKKILKQIERKACH